MTWLFLLTAVFDPLYCEILVDSPYYGSKKKSLADILAKKKNIEKIWIF